MIMKLLITVLLFTSSYASNALTYEASPYLRQHADNPVDWVAWSDEVLVRSREEKKPIFISIGYSTCHWCHVMAHESFENEAIAAIINAYFIPVKIDREEMSHIDSRYQKLHRKLKGRSGGWPLNAILTHDGEPFWIGTYVPPRNESDVEGMESMMLRIGEEYRHDPSSFMKQADAIKEIENESKNILKTKEPITQQAIFDSIEQNYDSLYHGFSKAPKFPEASKIALLLDLGQAGNTKAQKMGLDVLRAMALSGLYDQVEGGFFRYSTDAEWEIPHFEKMLYNQAELIPLYVRAYRLTKDPLYVDVVRETIQMTQKRFGHENLFYSASDADSEYHEGGYFIYTEEDIAKLKLSKPIKEAYDLEDGANFEEKYHLHLETSKRPEGFENLRSPLQKLRESRPYPFVDTKIITSWNAMMIEAMYKAGSIDESYIAQADAALETLLKKVRPNTVLYRQYMPGYGLKQKALLEDYSFLISALISGYQATLDEKKLGLAQTLADEAIHLFYTKNGWNQNSEGTRVEADLLDKYTTSGYGRMMQNLYNLSTLTEETQYGRLGQKSLEMYGANIINPSLNAPSSMIAWLMGHYGVVSLSHRRETLMGNKNAINTINYPYLLLHSEERDDFSACVTGACFANDKKFLTIKREIERLLK